MYFSFTLKSNVCKLHIQVLIITQKQSHNHIKNNNKVLFL